MGDTPNLFGTIVLPIRKFPFLEFYAPVVPICHWYSSCHCICPEIAWKLRHWRSREKKKKKMGEFRTFSELLETPLDQTRGNFLKYSLCLSPLPGFDMPLVYARECKRENSQHITNLVILWISFTLIHQQLYTFQRMQITDRRILFSFHNCDSPREAEWDMLMLLPFYLELECMHSFKNTLKYVNCIIS